MRHHPSSVRGDAPLLQHLSLPLPQRHGGLLLLPQLLLLSTLMKLQLQRYLPHLPHLPHRCLGLSRLTCIACILQRGVDALCCIHATCLQKVTQTVRNCELGFRTNQPHFCTSCMCINRMVNNMHVTPRT
jgi:hypothetical protein